MKNWIQHRKELAKVPGDLDALRDAGWSDVASGLERAAKELLRKCRWTLDSASDTTFTECGQVFSTWDGSLKFCPYCGGILVKGER